MINTLQVNFPLFYFMKKVALFLIISNILFSKSFSNSIDNELWTGLEINKKITSKVKLILGQQIRLKDHFSEFHKTFTNLSLSYKIRPLVDLLSSYRYIIYDDKNKIRINFDSKINFNYLFLSDYRFRLQHEFDDGGQLEEILSRNKLTLELPIFGKILPYSFFESFHVFEENLFFLNEYRIGIGIKHKLSKNHSLKTYYVYKGEIENKETESTGILGIKYEYDL